ncbi:MAG: group 1 truncated hemoglobin [Mycobacteriales bacterium]
MTDYEAIGGQEAVEQLVDRLYELVYADHQLRPYFAGVDPVRLKRHKARLLTYLLGGPANYGGQALRTAHQRLGIPHEHYLRMNAYLVGALWESGAKADVVLRISLLLDTVGRRIVDGAAATGDTAAPHHHRTEPGATVQCPERNGHQVLPSGQPPMGRA